mgnify:CR=1 FL=1
MSNWKKVLKEALTEPLPGYDAQKLMAPSNRFSNDDTIPSDDARISSVLLLIFPKHKRLFIPFIQRHKYKGAHSGQISLPGGKREANDKTNWDTAIRETREELGIDTSDIEYIGKLSPIYIPISNFIVHPYVGYLPYTPKFKPNEREVKEVLEVSIPKLFIEADSSNSFKKTIKDHEIVAPCFMVNEKRIWGATAMILSELNIIFRERLPRWANALHSYSAHNARGSL